MKKFSKYLKENMEKYKLSNAQVARGTGFAEGSISRYLSESEGHTNPQFDTVRKFESFFKYIEKRKELHQKLLKNIENLSEKEYKKVKKMRLNGGLLLSDRFDEKLQIFAGIEDSFFILADKILDSDILENTIKEWQGGDWDTTVMCTIINQNLDRIDI